MIFVLARGRGQTDLAGGQAAGSRPNRTRSSSSRSPESRPGHRLVVDRRTASRSPRRLGPLHLRGPSWSSRFGASRDRSLLTSAKRETCRLVDECACSRPALGPRARTAGLSERPRLSTGTGTARPDGTTPTTRIVAFWRGVGEQLRLVIVCVSPSGRAMPETVEPSAARHAATVVGPFDTGLRPPVHGAGTVADYTVDGNAFGCC
jgi:hypothetical protein